MTDREEPQPIIVSANDGSAFSGKIRALRHVLPQVIVIGGDSVQMPTPQPVPGINDMYPKLYANRAERRAAMKGMR